MPFIQFLQPAVLSTKDAHEYVGGKLIWEELAREYPRVLIPFRRVKRGDSYWLVAIIDKVLLLAQAEGTLLIHEPTESATTPPADSSATD